MPIEMKSNKPLWTEEFSVYGAEDKFVLRRQFSNFLVLTSFGMFAGNAWILLRSLIGRASAGYAEREIGAASQIGIGDVKLFNYPTENDPCIMVRMPSGRLVAYSQKCTHLSCAVYYSKRENRLECPCHEGYFSIEDGGVLQGPPRRALPLIQIRQDGDRLFATRVVDKSEGR
ncbi:MAG: ubiquinol-cytochrome c reductase iron-sulfur subunit [Acidobacteriaceae bacterium]|nr:ubiquinol-cytochrome c reductase iron-sulfur subunit [Acidobacteriaceae bacterium]